MCLLTLRLPVGCVVQEEREAKKVHAEMERMVEEAKERAGKARNGKPGKGKEKGTANAGKKRSAKKGGKGTGGGGGDGGSRSSDGDRAKRRKVAV